MKTLQIIRSAYRCTIEEQDDTAVLLRGAAVNYAVTGQDASGLAFGGVAQTCPPRIDRDVTIPDRAITSLPAVPPPMAIPRTPDGLVMGRPTPMAAANGSAAG